ncbi:hypothetical protein RMQ97_12190 [Maricaulis sp. D1M11]|uniref:hypothetical protein n=1 Tax=Maricaulis sp. D1M11 TaxID=3076117 RepID=UPI0039B3C0E7
MSDQNPHQPVEQPDPNEFLGREGKPTGDSQALTPEEEAARKSRNRAIGWSLFGFVVLVFLITVARLSQNIIAGS